MIGQHVLIMFHHAYKSGAQLGSRHEPLGLDSQHWEKKLHIFLND